MSDLVQDLIRKVQNILDREFSGPKTKIRVYHDRINFACPYCGDSDTNVHKKRANIYWKSMGFHCFNGGCEKPHASILTFLADHKERIKNIDHLNEVTDQIRKSSEENQKDSTLEFGYFKILKDEGVSVELMEQKIGLIRVEDSEFATKYLKGRLLYQKRELVRYKKSTNQLYILNLSSDLKKCVGYQIRNFDTSKKREKYMSFNLEKLKLDVGEKLDIDDSIKSEVNTLSLYFGILRCDFSKNVTVFEGPFDSMLLPNSIAISGLSKDITYFDSDKFRYMFDNDRDGLRVMETLIRSKKRVFLWKKFLSDHELRSDIKDLNDLIKKLWYSDKRNAISKIKDYFSDDPLDIFFV